MTAPSWQTAEQWLLAALDQPTAVRERFLRTKITDPALRQRVESLLAAEAHCDGFLEIPAYAMVQQQLDPDALPDGLPETEIAAGHGSQSQMVGRYRLIREIGRGGMSVVHLGERVGADFDQQVAIKLLHAGTLSEDARRRFRAERQMLAQLEHPGIARLLDGGTTEAGLPFLVMDHVIGLPIDRYCERHRLDISARLACFLDVCAAVAHAHRNLIVHRDIKPSNILVGEDGKPKLLDFGIAKLLGASPDGSYEETATWQRVLTPNYASPEHLHGGPITTACDVYSLGVLLYLLLVGRLPHRLEGESFEALSDQVRDRTPQMPSRAVASPEAAVHSAAGPPEAQDLRDDVAPLRAEARARGCSSPRQLARKLRGDLDTIVMTALHREPGRRYGSVGELVHDLQRHLDGRPVLARRDSLLYRAGKLVARNRLRVAAAAAILILLVSFGIERARNAGQLERERDEKEQVATFLVSLFDLPGSGPETEVQARRLLDRGVEQAQERLETQPGVGASLLHAIAQAYHNLGLYEDAVATFRQAQVLRLEVLGAGHPRYADTLHALGLALHKAGDLEASQQALRRALAIRRGIIAVPTQPAAETLQGLTMLVRDQGDYPRMLSLAEEAWSMRRGLLGEHHAQTAESLTAVAIARWELGEYAQAERLYLEALTILRDSVGNHPSLADALCGLVLLYQQQDHPAKALPLVREALAVRAEVFGTDHPLYLETLQTLGIAAAMAGSDALAEEAFREALVKTEKWFAEDHSSVGRASSNLGKALLRMGRHAEAEVHLERAVEIGASAVGEHHRRVAMARAGLAAVRGHTARPDEAEAIFERALGDLDASLGHDHPHTALIRLELAELLARTGQLRRAEELFARALPTVRAHRPESACDTGGRELAHARVLVRLDRLADAFGAAERAHTVFLTCFGPASEPVREVEGLLKSLRGSQRIAEMHKPAMTPSTLTRARGR